MQIKDLAIGDGYVYLIEGGSKVKFYVLCHNYESGLNGKGRTLFCRESPATTGTRHGNEVTSISWNETNIYSYLVNTYLNNFTSVVKTWLGRTKYYAYTWTGSSKYIYSSSSSSYYESLPFTKTSFSTSIFTISAKEVVTSSYLEDGSLLSKEARTRLEKIFTAYGSGIWTRSHSKVQSYRSGKDSDGDYKFYFANGQYLSAISNSDWGVFSTGSACSASCGYLPCFTLPETLYIDKDGFATENQPPEITSDAGESGVALGEKNEPFTLAYTVTDGDGDPMRIVEKVNGAEMAVRENVVSGTELTVQCLSEKVLFQQILNGENTLTLEVDDGKTTTDWTATFTKNVTRAVLSLAQPLTADDTITVAALTLEGSFPADMSLSVEMTNNALDDSPVWETVTDIQRGENRAFVHHAFTNKTAVRGFAFNYKITVTRGESGTGGTLTMIGGVIG